MEERRRRGGLVRRSRHFHGERRQPLLRQDDAESGSESLGTNRAGAHRRLRRRDAVQQPACRHRVESVSSAALRQRGRGEVARAHALYRGRVRETVAGSGSASRSLLRRAGFRSGRRDAARPRRTRRRRQLHGIGCDRKAHSEGRERASRARESVSGTRRQEPARRVR